MTDSANGTPADETPEVDASEHATLEKAIEEALDELPEAQLEEFVEETDDQEATEAAAAPKRWRLWRRKGDDGPTDEDTDDADDDADDDESDDADADADDDADDDESDDADADAGDEHDDEADDDEEDDEGEDGDEDYDDSAVAKRQRRLRRRRSYAPAGRVERNPWVYLGPLVGILVLLTLLPLVRLIVASLFERSLTAPDDTSFSHVRNFLDVLSARDWWLAVALTLVVVTVAVLAQLLLGAAFAGTLRRITFGGPWVQVLLLVPFVLMPAAVATAWRDGWVDGFATAWFRVDPGGGQLTALATLLSHEVWRGTGITTVILLAGLSRVKPSLLDATIADGATARQRLTQVVLPAVAPAVAVVALYRSLDALRSIEAPVLTAGELGDLSTASQLMWTTSFTDFEVGLGAAMALLLIVLAAGLGLLLTLLMQVRRTL
jgi:multiple sugar transport system permease protein